MLKKCFIIVSTLVYSLALPKYNFDDDIPWLQKDFWDDYPTQKDNEYAVDIWPEKNKGPRNLEFRQDYPQHIGVGLSKVDNTPRFQDVWHPRTQKDDASTYPDIISGTDMQWNTGVKRHYAQRYKNSWDSKATKDYAPSNERKKYNDISLASIDVFPWYGDNRFEEDYSGQYKGSEYQGSGYKDSKYQDEYKAYGYQDSSDIVSAGLPVDYPPYYQSFGGDIDYSSQSKEVTHEHSPQDEYQGYGNQNLPDKFSDRLPMDYPPYYQSDDLDVDYSSQSNEITHEPSSQDEYQGYGYQDLPDKFSDRLPTDYPPYYQSDDLDVDYSSQSKEITHESSPQDEYQGYGYQDLPDKFSDRLPTVYPPYYQSGGRDVDYSAQSKGKTQDLIPLLRHYLPSSPQDSGVYPKTLQRSTESSKHNSFKNNIELGNNIKKIPKAMSRRVSPRSKASNIVITEKPYNNTETKLDEQEKLLEQHNKTDAGNIEYTDNSGTSENSTKTMVNLDDTTDSSKKDKETNKTIESEYSQNNISIPISKSTTQSALTSTEFSPKDEETNETEVRQLSKLTPPTISNQNSDSTSQSSVTSIESSEKAGKTNETIESEQSQNHIPKTNAESTIQSALTSTEFSPKDEETYETGVRQLSNLTSETTSNPNSEDTTQPALTSIVSTEKDENTNETIESEHSQNNIPKPNAESTTQSDGTSAGYSQKD